MSYIYEIVVISCSPTCTDDSINMVTMTSLGDVVVQQAVFKKAVLRLTASVLTGN